MKQRIRVSILSVLCLIVLCGCAKEYSVSDLSDEQRGKIAGKMNYDNSGPLRPIGDIAVLRVLAFGDCFVALYPEFTQPEQAMEHVKERCPNLLPYMQETYGLDELSEKTWTDYQDSLRAFRNEEEWPNWLTEGNPEENEEYALLDQFFDIYENTSQNDELVAKAKRTASLSAFLNSDLIYDLPGDSAEQLKKLYMQKK